MDDLISRQALCEYALNQKDKSVTPNDIMRFPSAHSGCDEWCTDCKEYDQEKHCCPRFCRVIRETVEELKSEQSDVPDINVGDTISRQAAIDTIVKLTTCNGVRELFEYVQEHHLSDMWSGGIVDAIDAVIGVPSAQPKIIHCGDCRYWKNNHLCECLSKYGTFETEIYFYCGFAERREE